jgi:hypothetical protein
MRAALINQHEICDAGAGGGTQRQVARWWMIGFGGQPGMRLKPDRDTR